MRIFIILFIIGLAIEIVAFSVNQMENIPFVVKIISPKYARASNGLEKLGSSMVLTPSDEGFNEFQEIFLNLLRDQNPSEPIASISILKFQREGARLVFSQKRTKEVIPVKVFISNGQEINWNLEDLIANIEKFKKQNTFVTSIIIFLIGVIIQIIGFIIALNKKA